MATIKPGKVNENPGLQLAPPASAPSLHASTHENGGSDQLTVNTDAAANRVWAGPTSGAADAPAFRALQPKDVPQVLLTPISVGRNGAGAMALTGTQVGDIVQSIANLSSSLDVTAEFESVITVAGQIQQSGSGNYTAARLLFFIRRQATA